MDTICVVSVELWLVCGCLLWAKTLTKQWGRVWLFEKDRVRVQPGILDLLKCSRSYYERIEKSKHIHTKRKKPANKRNERKP